MSQLLTFVICMAFLYRMPMMFKFVFFSTLKCPVKYTMADIEDVCDSKKSDFMSAGSSIITSINYKVAILLLFISFIIFSDLFVDSVLMPIPETVIAGQVTTKGTLIQIVCLIIGYIASDLSVKYELI